MKARNVLIDIKTCDMTLGEVMEFIGRYQAEHPTRNVFMDGDLYAVVYED